MADEPHGTHTLEGARHHARGQDAGTGAAGRSPSRAGATHLVWGEVIAPGNYASCRLPRGAVLRIADPQGDACVQLLVHNARQPGERLNVADTVKVQWQAYLGRGALLLSDMGRVLMTIVDDTSERHDCLCGCTNRTTAGARHGDGGASGAAPERSRPARARRGQARPRPPRRGPCINLFKSARVGADGALTFDGGPRPGSHGRPARRDGRVRHAGQHTASARRPRDGDEATGAQCIAWLPGRGTPTGAFRATTPERERAFDNTESFLAGLGR